MATTPVLRADDPWSIAKARFLKDLEPSERQLFDNATLENIYSTTNNANTQDVDSNKTRNTIQKLGPLISAIESYGSALDTFTQIAPLYLSPIWGSIRVLLVTARCHSKFYDKIVDTLSRIGDILPGFRDYERIYDRHKHQRLTTALSDTYLDIIVICTKFRQCLRNHQSSSFRRVLKPLSFGYQFEDAIETFRRHKNKVREEAKICHMVEAAEQRKHELVLAATARRQKLLSKLSNVDYLRRYRKLKDSRHEGTGIWVTSIPEYQQWEQLGSSAVLCCYGIPGCGKSVLASSILDSLGKTQSPIFYYCDYADKRTLDPSNIFGTLSRQLLENIDLIPEDLALNIEQAPQDGEKIANPNDALSFLVKATHLSSGPIYMVIDGLDEASEQSQKVIYQGLKEILIDSLVCVKQLITGREEVSSHLKLPSSFWYRKIPISSIAITHDIDSYIRASMKRRILNGSLAIHDPNLEKMIVETLVQGAQGMFLWVEFQLNDLCEAESDHGIKIVLQNLPKNLSETYDRLLDRIEGSERRDMIKKLFKWMACARQPLHVDEIREGIAFTLFDEEWSREKIPTDFKRLVRACSNLVVVDEENQVVELAHYTVQQYLLKPDATRFNFTMEEANIMAGEICVAYLNFSNFDTQIARYRDNSNSELVEMGRLASRGQLFSRDGTTRAAMHAWKTLRGPTPPVLTNLDLTKYGPRPKTRMQDFSQFALLDYVKSHWLWHTREFTYQRSIDPNSRISYQEDLFKKLVLGPDLLFPFRPWRETSEEQTDILYKQIFGWALDANHVYLVDTIWPTCRIEQSSILHEMVVNDWTLLLQKHNIKLDSYQLPRRLLDDIENDIPSAEFSTPGWLYRKVVRAARNDCLDIIQSSIQFNDDLRIGSKTKSVGHIMLHLLLEAAAYGALSIVKAFQQTKLDYMTFVVECGDQNLNSLELAVLAGHLEVVMYLAGNEYSTPNLIPGKRAFIQHLIANTDAGNLSILKCLFCVRTPDIELKVSEITDVVTRAAQVGNTHTVELLLNHLAASTSRQVFCRAMTKAIKFLIEDPSAIECLFYFWSPGIKLDPLQVADIVTRAVGHGNVQVVDILLNHFANSVSRQTFYELFAGATMSSRLQIVELLLQHFYSGIDEYFMPLTLAVSLGNLDVVKLMLPHNPNAARSSLASIMSRESQPENDVAWSCVLYPTPLYMACYYRNMPIIEVLLEHGASGTFPSPTNLTRLKCENNNMARFQIDINPILAHLQKTPSLKLPIYRNESLSVPWEAPISLALRNKDEELYSVLLCSTKKFSNTSDAAGSIELSPELSIVTGLLSNDNIRSSNINDIICLIKNLVSKFRYDKDGLLLLLNDYSNWVEWFCWALDNNNQLLRDIISRLSPDRPKLFGSAMSHTIQCDARHRIRPLLKLAANTTTFATILQTDHNIIDAAQNRVDPEYDELRTFLHSSRIIHRRRRWG